MKHARGATAFAAAALELGGNERLVCAVIPRAIRAMRRRARRELAHPAVVRRLRAAAVHGAGDGAD